MSTLLIVDDEPNVLYSLEKALKSDALRVVTAMRAKQAIDLVQQSKPDAVVLDIRLPDMSGLDAFDRIHEIDPRLPVVIMTAHATTETAIEAMKRGAYDYLVKPVDVYEIREVVSKAIELSRLARVPAVFEIEASDDPSADHIVGFSPIMQRVYKDIGRVAPQHVNVLILLEEALRQADGNQVLASKLLGISRTTLRAKLSLLDDAIAPDDATPGPEQA